MFDFTQISKNLPRARRALCTFPKRTHNARAHVGTLETSVIGTRFSHMDINGNSIWFIATTHGVFRTCAFSWSLDPRTLTGAVKLKIDGRGTVFSVQRIDADRDPYCGWPNAATHAAVTVALNEAGIYFPARAGFMSAADLAVAVTALMPDWARVSDVVWGDVVGALLEE